MSFGYGFGLPSWQTLSGGFNPSSLFVGGVQGTWFDPSDPDTLFSDTAGTTPSPTPGAGALSVVGSMLDKRAAGYSVFFNGTTDSLTTPDNAAFNLAAGDWTIEAWVYSTATGANQAIGGQSDVGASSLEYSAVLRKTSGNKLQVTIGGSPGSPPFNATSSADLPLNAWTHVAAVRNGNVATLYINGAADGTVNLTGITVNNSTGSFAVGKFGSANLQFWAGYISNFRFVVGTAVYTANFTPPTSPLSPISGTSLLTCGTSWTGNPAITVNGDCKINQINPFVASPLGNHAISYNTTTARPELSARVNLLTYSEQFDNAAWLKVGGAVSANTTVAPDGTTTADTFTASNTFLRHAVLSNAGTGIAIAANTSVVFSAYIRKGNYNFVSMLVTNNVSTWFVATFDFSGATPVVSKTGNGAGGTFTSASVEAANNGFWRLTIRGSTTDTAILGEIALNSSATPTYGSYGEEIWTAAGTETVITWGADLRPANIGTSVPAYQRIADQYTYDSSGFPRYLVFNGVASGMYTPANLNLSGTDKATVFAGVRKLATGTLQLVEFSADASVNNGAFSMPQDVGTNTWTFASRGTSLVAANSGNLYTPPVSTVNTGIGNISAPAATLRVNGAVVANNTQSQGTGNYGNYPLNIGVRSATATPSLFFNGYLYSLVVVGAASTAAQITSTESWINVKEGTVY